MPLERKTRRSEVAELTRATMDFKDPGAEATAKMMMVPLSGDFVARRLAWQFDRGQPLGLDQRGNSAVDSRDAEASYMAASGFEHFSRTQWTTRVLKNAADGIALTCSTFHSQ